LVHQAVSGAKGIPHASSFRPSFDLCRFALVFFLSLFRVEKMTRVSDDIAATLKAPINIKLEIPYFTVSGVQVRYLKIIEKSGYQALPWVRYITQNGDYQIRMF